VVGVDLEIRPFTPEEAVVAASWRYPGALAIYGGDADEEPLTSPASLGETSSP